MDVTELQCVWWQLWHVSPHRRRAPAIFCDLDRQLEETGGDRTSVTAYNRRRWKGIVWSTAPRQQSQIISWAWWKPAAPNNEGLEGLRLLLGPLLILRQKPLVVVGGGDADWLEELWLMLLVVKHLLMPYWMPIRVPLKPWTIKAPLLARNSHYN